jgi:hypothetical protein
MGTAAAGLAEKLSLLLKSRSLAALGMMAIVIPQRQGVALPHSVWDDATKIHSLTVTVQKGGIAGSGRRIG